MRAFRKFCHQIGVQPVHYFSAFVVSFTATTANIFCQSVERFHDRAFLFFPIMFLPFLVVMFSASGTRSERMGSIMYGALITFFALVPAVILGMALGGNLK
jgi:hypothetical protein